MTKYEEIQEELKASPKKWLVTGVAGFIGSNLLEKLLRLDQTVIVGLSGYSRPGANFVGLPERRIFARKVPLVLSLGAEGRCRRVFATGPRKR